MEKSIKIKNTIIILLNLLVVLMEMIGAYHSYHKEGFFSLRYYTVLSNIFALVVAFLYAVHYIRNFQQKTVFVPGWLKQMKYIDCICLAVTFVVVLTVLIPMEGIQSIDHYIFGKANIYHHVFCPIVMIFAFCTLEKERKISKRDNVLAMIPTVIYAIVMMILNLLKILRGPYPFLYVYEQPVYMSVVWCIAILSLTFGLGWILRVLNGKGQEKN